MDSVNMSVGGLRRRPVAGICVLAVVYAVFQSVLLRFSHGNAVMAFSMLPILCAGWLWGWKAAAATGLAVYATGIPVLYHAVGRAGMQASMRIGVPMLAFYTLLGALVGRVTEMDRRLKRELETRKDMERRLRLSNQELVDFAHIASHDLQEPLRKVSAFGDRLADRAGDALDDRAKDYLARMQNAARRMSGLLDGLLGYARIATKGSPFKTVDMDNVTADVLNDLEVRLNETGGRVVTGNLGTVEADPLQMRQLVQNLVGNALKYHKPDVPPAVKVSSRITEDGAWYELDVKDNGIGIADEDKEKAFGIFQRLVGKGEYEGTGVGLAICKKITERHGGTIALQGDPGKGTTFTVRLPVKRAHPEFIEAVGAAA